MKLKTRVLVAVAALGATAVALSGCSGGAGSQHVAAKAPTHLSGTISLWHHYSDREADVIQSAVNGFEKKYPDVKVQVHANQTDDKITQAMASGSKVDVLITNVNNTLGTVCNSMVDLTPYMKRDGVSMSEFQGGFATATAFDGRRCSLPTTSDVMGLYYNTSELQAAGYTQPPKTLEQLEQMALKLTTYNSDGSIKTLGFDPLIGFYENVSSVFGPAANATWMTKNKSTISKDPQWTELLNWQKDFVNKIGYQKLKTFTAGLGDEWSANNAFQTGQVAMVMDGEWRTAFIASQKPSLKYGTAPFPTLADASKVYGGGGSSAADIGISNNSKNAELSWALVKYLTTNTDAAVTLANGLGNIPTLKAAAESPALKYPPQYKTFLTIAKSPYLATAPITPIGATLTQTMDNFWESYQSSSATSPAAGLKKVDSDINNALSLREAK